MNEKLEQAKQALVEVESALDDFKKVAPKCVYADSMIKNVEKILSDILLDVWEHYGNE